MNAKNRSILKCILAIIFFFVKGNLKAQNSLHEFQVCYGGKTFLELKCDSINFSLIADKEIYLFDSKSNTRYDIDSFVVFRQLPFHDLYPYYVKGNKFPTQIVNDLKSYTLGISIIIDKAYYYVNGVRKEYINDEVLLICDKEFLKRKPVEYRPGLEKIKQ